MKYKCIANFFDFKEGEIYGFRTNYNRETGSFIYSFGTEGFVLGLPQATLDKYFEDIEKRPASKLSKDFPPEDIICICIDDLTDDYKKGNYYKFIKTYDADNKKYWFEHKNLGLIEVKFEEFFEIINVG